MNKFRHFLLSSFLLICFIFSSAFLSAAKPKIYDCFMFFNELELLEVRLNELYGKVDKFVIVESTKTFQGNPKPLYFKENAQRFAKFADKIFWVLIDDPVSDSWANESFQRNQIMRALVGCKNNDIIMISDLDEIIRASSVDTIVECLSAKKYPYVHCEQTFYRFFLNVQERAPWIGSSATTYGFLKQKSPQFLRDSRTTPIRLGKKSPFLPIIKNSGWHFSWMGGIDRLILKLESFSHAELNKPEYKNFHALKTLLSQDCNLVAIDDSYPKFVLQNLSSLREVGFILSE